MRIVTSTCIFILISIFSSTICIGQDTEDLYKQGISLYNNSEYIRAEIIFRSILSQNENNDQLCFLIGMCCAFQGNLDEAERWLHIATEINPTNDEYYSELGGIYFRKREFGKAHEMLLKAQRINPENSYTLELLGAIYNIKNLNNESLQVWNKLDKPILHEFFIEKSISNKKYLHKELCLYEGQIVTPNKLLETQMRLEKIGNFSDISINVIPAELENSVNLSLHLYQESGFADNINVFFLNAFKDIFNKTISIDYKNVVNKNINLFSLYRFHKYNQKINLKVTLPRYNMIPFYLSSSYTKKIEKWNFEDSKENVENDYDISSDDFKISFDFIINDRTLFFHYLKIKSLSIFVPSEASNFQYDTNFYFSLGGVIKKALVRDFEANYEIDVGLDYQFSLPLHAHNRIGQKGLIRLNMCKYWEKKLSNENTSELSICLNLGLTSNNIPFDQLFLLGVGNSESNLLRAHNIYNNGKLGFGPIANDFLLSNIDYDFNIYSKKLFKISGGIFVDQAYIMNSINQKFQKRLLTDIGGYLELNILNLPLLISYGYNLENRTNCIFIGSRFMQTTRN